MSRHTEQIQWKSITKGQPLPQRDHIPPGESPSAYEIFKQSKRPGRQREDLSPKKSRTVVD